MNEPVEGTAYIPMILYGPEGMVSQPLRIPIKGATIREAGDMLQMQLIFLLTNLTDAKSALPEADVATSPAQSEALEQSVSWLYTDIENMHRTINRLQSELRAAIHELDTRRAKSTESDIHLIEELTDSVIKHKAALEAKDRTIRGLLEQLSSRVDPLSTVSQISTDDEPCVTPSAMMSILEENIVKLHNLIAEKERIIAEKERIIADRDASLALATADASSNEQRENLQKLQCQLDQRSAEFEQSQKLVAMLQEDLANRSDIVEGLSSELRTAKREASQMAEAARILRTERDGLSQYTKSLTVEVERLRGIVASHVTDREALGKLLGREPGESFHAKTFPGWCFECKCKRRHVFNSNIPYYIELIACPECMVAARRPTDAPPLP
jgi:chromosome segregation ATPase